MGQEERERFVKQKLEQGLTLHDALVALSEEGFERGDKWTGFYASQAAIEVIRPPSIVMGEF